MRLLTILALCVSAAPLFAQDSIDQQIAQIQQKTEALQQRLSAPPKSQSKWPSYSEAAAQATKERRPLIVFVSGNGLNDLVPRAIAGCIVCEGSPYQFHVENAVVVSAPNGQGWLTWHATLPATATDSDIRTAAGLGASRLALPFDKSFSRSNTSPAPRRPTADDSGPWLSRAESERIKGLWRRAIRTSTR